MDFLKGVNNFSEALTGESFNYILFGNLQQTINHEEINNMFLNYFQIYTQHNLYLILSKIKKINIFCSTALIVEFLSKVLFNQSRKISKLLIYINHILILSLNYTLMRKL